MKLKIFSDKNYLPRGIEYEVIFYPFWGKNPEEEGDPETGKYDRYEEMGSTFFELTSLMEASIAILPFNWNKIRKNKSALRLAFRFAKEAKKAEVPVVVFFFGDSCRKVPIDDAIVFRTSLYRSTRRPNEFAMPGWSEDFVGKYLRNKLSIREKQETPTVGFCGCSPSPVRVLGSMEECVLQFKASIATKRGAGTLISNISQIITPMSGRLARSKSLGLLSRSSMVKTNFILRDEYWGGALYGRGLLHERAKARSEYVKNILESDYILCTRGVGNYSFRLYEALCCGRIPVFIDTDCVLPYDFEIEWKKYCVWIDQSEINKVAEKIAEFHKNLSPQAFINMQYGCRRLWEEWVSPEGFFANFFRHFRDFRRKRYTRS